MHVLLGLVTASCIHCEILDIRLAEIMLNEGAASDDDATAAAARWWWLPLSFLQKLRLNALLPMVAVASPMLAVFNGIDAFDAALNVLAVLFILEVDDLAYTMALSKRQQELLESMEYRVSASDQRLVDSTIIFAVLATLTS